MTDNQDLKSFQRLVQKGKQTRKEPPIGDLFCLTLDPWETSHEFIWGRLIKKDCKQQGYPAWLVYIYNNTTSTQTPPDREWKFEDLLIAPLLTAKTCWNTGMFKSSFISILPLEDEMKRIHYHRHPGFAYKEFKDVCYDDDGNLVVLPTQGLIGSNGIHSRSTLAWDIDHALGRNNLYDYRELERRYPNPNKTTN